MCFVICGATPSRWRSFASDFSAVLGPSLVCVGSTKRLTNQSCVPKRRRFWGKYRNRADRGTKERGHASSLFYVDIQPHHDVKVQCQLSSCAKTSSNDNHILSQAALRRGTFARLSNLAPTCLFGHRVRWEMGREMVCKSGSTPFAQTHESSNWLVCLGTGLDERWAEKWFVSREACTRALLWQSQLKNKTRILHVPDVPNSFSCYMKKQEWLRNRRYREPDLNDSRAGPSFC